MLAWQCENSFNGYKSVAIWSSIKCPCLTASLGTVTVIPPVLITPPLWSNVYEEILPFDGGDISCNVCTVPTGGCVLAGLTFLSISEWSWSVSPTACLCLFERGWKMLTASQRLFFLVQCGCPKVCSFTQIALKRARNSDPIFNVEKRWASSESGFFRILLYAEILRPLNPRN